MSSSGPILKTLWEAAEEGDLIQAREIVGRMRRKKALPQKMENEMDPLVAPGGVYGWSPLSAAAKAHSADIVRLLLDAGADPNHRDADGDFFPIHWASNAETAQLLCDAGADLSLKNRAGETALDVALASDNKGGCRGAQAGAHVALMRGDAWPAGARPWLRRGEHALFGRNALAAGPVLARCRSL